MDAVAMDEIQVLLPVGPDWLPLGEGTLASAQAKKERSQDRWTVTISLSAEAYGAAVDRQAVAAQLRDGNGIAWEPLDPAELSDSQIGEELRTVTEIVFHFGGAVGPPLDLLLTHRQQEARFRLDERPARK
jgi:hypothetical protein